VVYSIRYEMAVSIEDILARRIGLQLFSWRDAITAAPIVAAYLADELGWTSTQSQEAIQRYREKINRLLVAVGLAMESPAADLAGFQGREKD
jgi:glycerol-3-phosphate dehydrogenase